MLHSENPVSDANKILASFSLLFVYYRSFSYLRIIDAFTTLIGMINTIIIKLLVFFFILFYLFIATGLVMVKLNKEKTVLENFQIAYLWTFFGGVEGSDFQEFPYSTITILFGTILVTVVLLNILIAYLSNLFSRLEDQQRASDFREKASMILDMEIIIYFFKYKLRGKVSKFLEYNKLREKEIASLDLEECQSLVIIIRI